MNFRIKRPVSPPTRTASLLRWSQYPFFVLGILALGYVGFVLLDTWFFQAYQTWRFQQAMKGSKPAIGSVEQLASSPLPARAEADRARAEGFGINGLAGSPVGRIEISSIGLAAIIRVTSGSVRRAVG
jgi:hypothetical protein